MKKYFKFILFLGISLIFLTGCVGDLVVPENDVNSPATEGSSAYENPTVGLGTAKGTLKIYLTDAPGDYEKVNINISRIEGHIAVEDEEGYWEILKEWPDDGLAVDLIMLENVSILLGSKELAPNKYTQLRIFLNGEASLVLEGEGVLPVTVPLEIPSSANTGIKLNRPFEIIAGMITKLTIDFDAEKSVIKTGNGKYKMKPVIHVTSEIIPEEEVSTGSVFGTVSYYDSQDLELTEIVGASVSLSGGEYIFVYNTTTLGDGSFDFLDNVPVGNCVLNVYADGFDEYSESIEVIADADTVVDVVFLAEEPGGISGSVVDSVSKLAIEGGATITVTLSGSSTYIFGSSTETDVAGSFLIEQLPVGSYDLTVSAVGYDVHNDVTPGGIVVTAGGVIDIGIIGLELLPAP
jgi:hypothetical protein